MSCILNKIFPERCDFEPSEKFKMSSLVLIEMAITFEILKTYTGFDRLNFANNELLFSNE